MKLDSLENTDVTDSLNEVYKFLNKNLYGTEEFKNLYDYLRGGVRWLYKDIMEIRLDIAVRNKNNI